MWQLRLKNIELDRKVLSNVAIVFPKVFDVIVKEAS
jgi:ribosomal protein L20